MGPDGEHRGGVRGDPSAQGSRAEGGAPVLERDRAGRGAGTWGGRGHRCCEGDRLAVDAWVRAGVEGGRAAGFADDLGQHAGRRAREVRVTPVHPCDAVDPDGKRPGREVATPPLKVPVPRVVLPSLNVTVPVGVPAPGEAAVTVAVKVTG